MGKKAFVGQGAIQIQRLATLTSSEIADICQDTLSFTVCVRHRLLQALGLGRMGMPTQSVPNEVKSLAQSLQHTSSCNMEEWAKERNIKAVKADDITIPVYLWDQCLVPDLNSPQLHALGTLRVFALRWWKMRLRKAFNQCFCTEYSLPRAPAIKESKLLQNWD
jgi:hypothetical protein